MKMDKCKCDFRTKMVGDGCRYCNPEFYIDILEERIQELEDELLIYSDLLDEKTISNLIVMTSESNSDAADRIRKLYRHINRK